jgi:hypothetical protein
LKRRHVLAFFHKLRRAWLAPRLALHPTPPPLLSRAGGWFFDQATAVAIERFQMNHDLYVKGVIDRQLLDALVCGNNVMAIGAPDAALRLLGREVSRDLAIVGQDRMALAG